jgi:hypothetical protein
MEENELLQNELLAGEVPEKEEEPTYNVIYSPGTSTGLFDPRTGTEDRTGDAEYNGEMRVEQLTESQIKERWDSDTFLQDQFGDFENYMGYVAESSDAFAETNWWESKGIDNRTETEKLREEDDLGRGDTQIDTAYDQKQLDDNARKSGYRQWLMSDENQALMQKYGVSDTVMNDKGDKYIWMGNGYTLVDEADEMEFSDWAKTGIIVATSIAIGNAAGVAAAGTGAASMPGWMVGAIKGGVGSVVSQGLTTGSIDPSSLFQSVLLGGVGGLVGDLANMDGSIFSDTTGLTGKADEIVSGLSDMLKIPYDEALQIADGIATGLIVGDDITSIVLNAAGKYAQGEIMDVLQGAYGDTVQVADWFKDGASNIPIEALEPFVGGAIQTAINGGADSTDALRMIWDYHQAGGDLDFILPPGVDMPEGGALDWLNAQLPDVTINWNSPEFEVTYEEGVEEDEKDKVTVDIPGVDVDIDVDIPEVKCPTGERWSTDLSKCIPDIELPEVPEVVCPTGERWSTNLSKCVPDVKIPEVPDVVECVEGFEWSDILNKCVEIPEIPDVVECVEGFEWSDVFNKCVEIPELPDAVECMEGWQWDDLLGKCVEIPDVPEVPDVVECVEGFEWSDILNKCVEIEGPEDTEDKDVDVDVDVDGVDVPDVPSVKGGSSPSYEQTPQGLFDYINISPQQAAQLTPYVDYVQKARGMLS